MEKWKIWQLIYQFAVIGHAYIGASIVIIDGHVVGDVGQGGVVQGWASMGHGQVAP